MEDSHHPERFMAVQLKDSVGPVSASRAETRVANEASRKLASYLPTKKQFHLQIDGDRRAEPMVIPQSAVKILLNVLREMAKGNAVTIAPIQEELNISQATELLNVSRPRLAKLLDAGEVPSHKVGARRRIRHRDALAYKQRLFDSRLKALEELQDQAQELGMGY